MARSFKELLARADKATSDIPELHASVQKLAVLVESDPEAGLMRVRKMLEFVIHDLYTRRFAESLGTRPLENLLQKMAREGYLPKKLGPSANLIRELGNLGVHSHGESIDASNVEGALEHLLPILAWYRVEIGSPQGQQPNGETKPPPPPPVVPWWEKWTRQVKRPGVLRWVVFGTLVVLVAAGALGYVLSRGPADKTPVPAPDVDRAIVKREPEPNPQPEPPVGDELVVGSRVRVTTSMDAYPYGDSDLGKVVANVGWKGEVIQAARNSDERCQVRFDFDPPPTSRDFWISRDALEVE